MEKREALRNLRTTRNRIEKAESKLEELRQTRNVQIVDAIDAGATEREAAAEAGVSAPFAHRIKVAMLADAA